MGSSAKRKKEKKKDFQKPKLKVGKAKPKAVNHTDVNFSAKTIVLNQQSLAVDAPSAAHAFSHQVSLLSSRADSQRRDALAYLTNQIGQQKDLQSLPMTCSALLDKICPLILDGVGSVRNQLLKLLQVIPPSEIRDHIGRILPYIRAGVTHLSKDIRAFTMDLLSWLTPVAGQEIISSPGGWTKTLECLCTVLGWKTTSIKDWSKGKLNLAGDTKATARTVQVLTDFLRLGLSEEMDQNDPRGINKTEWSMAFPLWNTTSHLIPTKSNAYAYLNLFSVQIDDDNQMLETCDERARVFNARFRTSIEAGIEATRQEGGEIGRVAGSLMKAINIT